MNGTTRKRPSVTAKARCGHCPEGCVPRRAQQCPVCTGTSCFTFRPSRDDVASKACNAGCTVARLAGHDLASAQHMRRQQRPLFRWAPGLANSAPVALCLSNSRTDPWHPSADPTAATSHVSCCHTLPPSSHDLESLPWADEVTPS